MSSTVIITDVLPYTQSIASSGQTQFDTDWTADVAADVVVYARATGVAANDVTQLISSSNYTVSFVGSEQFVRVTFSVGRTLSDIVTITRQTPVDRENLYINTNFTPSMLNSDFGRQTMMTQERELLNVNITPRYNTSATVVAPKDVILPILAGSQTWRKNSGNTAFEAYDLPDGGIAPADATYVTIDDESADLPNSYQLTGTANQISVTNAIIAIVPNPDLTGTEGLGLPTGNTAQRPVSPSGTNLRFNTNLVQLEYWDGTSWEQLEDSGDFSDLANLKFILQQADAIAPNAQSLGALSTGILKSTTTTGVLSISAPLTSIDGLTTVANNLIYTTAANTYAVITPANGGVLITNNLGAPSWLANPAAAGRMLQSGNAAAATWSTPTYPSASGTAGQIIRSDGTNNVYSTMTYLNTIGVNEIPFASSANVMGVISAANSSVLITSAGGVPSMSQTLPSAVQDNITRLGTQAEALNMGTQLINNVVDPVSAQDAATKNYVDQIALSGTSVYAATTATLNATQAGAGVGATLTDASGTFAAFSVDGQSPPVGSDILNKDQAAAANQGIYTLTTNGDGVSIPWVLTRSTTYDTPSQINQTGLIIVRHGTVNAGRAYYNASTMVTVDTTAFSYSRFGGTFPIVVADGGTGVTSLTAYAPIFGGTTGTGAVQSGTVGTAGQVLTSNGAGVLPTFQAASSGASAASQAEMETGTATTVYVSPGRQQYHPSSPKSWAGVTYSAGTPVTLGSAYNVTSYTDVGTGVYQANFTTAFATVGAATVGGGAYALGNCLCDPFGTTNIQVRIYTDAAAAVDNYSFFSCWGDFA